MISAKFILIAAGIGAAVVVAKSSGKSSVSKAPLGKPFTTTVHRGSTLGAVRPTMTAAQYANAKGSTVGEVIASGVTAVEDRAKQAAADAYNAAKKAAADYAAAEAKKASDAVGGYVQGIFS